MAETTKEKDTKKDEKPDWMGMTPDKKKLKVIKVLTKKKGWNMIQLAAVTGLSTETIYRYMRGAVEPKAINLYKIAKALDTTVIYILEESGIEFKPQV